MGETRDILIAGAGPVGLAAAIELARRGFSPRIVDAGDGPAPLNESRAIGVNARTLTLMSPCGVTEHIVSQAQDIAHFRIRSRSKILASVDTHRIAGRFGALHMLAQGATERILIDALATHGIAPQWNTTLESLDADANRPRASLRHADGRVEPISCDIVIGADGAHSAVRKTLGLGFPGQALEASFYLADFRYATAVETDFAEISLFDPGMIARLPVSGDTIRYLSTLEDFESRIDHPAAVAEKPWASQFRIHFRHVGAMSKGSVFLAGDAAHIHSPAGARGMNLGIEDACWLAYLIAEGREQEYSALRLPAVKQVLKQTHGLTRMATLQNPLALALRDAGVPALLGIGPLRRVLLNGIAGYDTPKPPWIDWAE